MHTWWARLERIAHARGLPLALRPPATEAAIAAAEHALELPFPDDFRASLAVHDGQDPVDDEELRFEWLPGMPPLASLARIVEEHARDRERFATYYPDGELEVIEGGMLHHALWHPRRCPIAGNAWFDQDNLYLDFVPGPRGHAGQLAMFGKGVFGEVIAPSFESALAVYVSALERGAWPPKRPTSFARFLTKHGRFG